MKFENISTEEDFQAGQIRMAVLWEKEDVERFSDFFQKDMVDVVQLIGDGGVIGALVSPQLPSDPARESEIDDRDAMWCGALVGALNIEQVNDVLGLFQKIRDGEVQLPKDWIGGDECGDLIYHEGDVYYCNLSGPHTVHDSLTDEFGKLDGESMRWTDASLGRLKF